MITGERAGIWAAVVTALLAILSLAYSAGQLARDVELLRSDVASLEQYFLDFLSRP